MQTFLPFADYIKSAQALDDSRLHNQVNEALVIMASALRLRRVEEDYVPVPVGEKVGWENHPAVKMWAGSVKCLGFYVLDCMYELSKRRHRRGPHASDPVRHERLVKLWRRSVEVGSDKDPAWIANEALFRSHQSNLIRKLPEHYVPLFPGVPNDLPYVWPAGHP